MKKNSVPKLPTAFFLGTLALLLAAFLFFLARKDQPKPAVPIGWECIETEDSSMCLPVIREDKRADPEAINVH